MIVREFLLGYEPSASITAAPCCGNRARVAQWIAAIWMFEFILREHLPGRPVVRERLITAKSAAGLFSPPAANKRFRSSTLVAESKCHPEVGTRNPTYVCTCSRVHVLRVHESRVTSHEFMSYELRVTSYELRVTSYELRVHELRVTSYEL